MTIPWFIWLNLYAIPIKNRNNYGKTGSLHGWVRC